MVLGFSTKKKPSLPMYEEQKDTPWITRNRELNSSSYDNLNRDLNNVNVFDDATKQQLNAYNDSIYNRAVKDFDRDYAQTMNKYLARDYNRFGTTGGTSSLLTRDNYNLAQQRKLADMEYNRAMNYEDMINQELSRRYNWLNLNNQLFNQSGTTTQAFDDANWKIRLQNQDRAYENAVQKYNNSLEHITDQLVHQVGGAVASRWLGPLGTQIGNAMTNAFASDAKSMLSGNTYGTGLQDFFNSNKWQDALGYYGAKKGMPGWSDYINDNKYLFGSNSGMFSNSGSSNALNWLGSRIGNLNYDNALKQLLYELLLGVKDTRGNVVDANTGIMNT